MFLYKVNCKCKYRKNITATIKITEKYLICLTF